MNDATNLIYLLSLAGTVVLMLGIGLWVARRNRSGEDFLLAGRSLSTPLLLGTTLATLVGTGSSLGAVGFAYENGWAGGLYGIGGAVGVLLLLWLFSGVRKHGFMTFSEEMSYYYGASRAVKGVVSIVMLLASVGWLGAHIMGGALYLSYLTGLDPTTSKIVIAVSFGLYTVVGGYLAVVITDAIQGTILFIGFSVLAVLALVHVGGFEGIGENVPESDLDAQAGGGRPVAGDLSLALVVARVCWPPPRTGSASTPRPTSAPCARVSAGSPVCSRCSRCCPLSPGWLPAAWSPGWTTPTWPSPTWRPRSSRSGSGPSS